MTVLCVLNAIQLSTTFQSYRGGQFIHTGNGGPYLKWQWIFYFSLNFCSFLLSMPRLWSRLYIWVIQQVSYKKKELLILCEHPSSPRFLVGSVLLIILPILCCPFMCLFVLSSVMWCLLRFPNKDYVWLVFNSSCL